MKDIKRLLTRAAKQLETEGWCQGRYSDDKGRCCLLGALGRTCRDHYDYELAGEVVRFYTGATELSVWNDEPERTAKEVIATLKGAASIL